jgi:hypothetical protein
MPTAMTDNSTAATSVAAGEEALSPFKIAQAYSHSNSWRSTQPQLTFTLVQTQQP